MLTCSIGAFAKHLIASRQLAHPLCTAGRTDVRVVSHELPLWSHAIHWTVSYTRKHVTGL